jgi:hypothetical protein
MSIWVKTASGCQYTETILYVYKMNLRLLMNRSAINFYSSACLLIRMLTVVQVLSLIYGPEFGHVSAITDGKSDTAQLSL